MYCRHPGSLRCTRSSLFHLDSRHRSRRSFGLAGFSPAARGFGSNGDRADVAGTGREDQTERGGTNYVGSNSEGVGTSGRGACPRQNSCQSAKLIRVSRANSDIPLDSCLNAKISQLVITKNNRLEFSEYSWHFFRPRCCKIEVLRAITSKKGPEKISTYGVRLGQFAVCPKPIGHLQ